MVGKLTPNDIVSASRVPALLNASPYETPNDVMKSCNAARDGQPLPGIDQNEAMAWGDTLEPVILAEASKRLGLKHTRFDYQKAFFHGDISLAASLDGTGCGFEVVEDGPDWHSKNVYCVNGTSVDICGPGVLEAKNTGSQPELAPAPFRGPLQLQAQLMCTKFTWGAVCVLYRGTELRIFLYQADPVVQKKIADAVKDFELRRLGPDWYPAMSSADANTIYDNVDDGADEIDLDAAGGNEFLAELLEGKKMKQAAEERIEYAEAGLKDVLGVHESGFGTVGNQHFKVLWKMRNYSAQPEKVVPAKPARKVRQNTLTLKALDQ